MMALVLVAMAQLLDLTTLFAGLAIGAGELEANAPVRWAWTFGGPFLVLAWKSALLVLLLVGIDRLDAAPFRWARVAGPALGISIGLAGAAANVAVLAVVVAFR